MITITIIIFVLATIASFGVLSYSAWEVRTGVRTHSDTPALTVSLKNAEKYSLYTLKHLVQSFVISVVKYWFLAIVKTRKWIAEKWPRVHKIIRRKPVETNAKHTFVSRSIAESKVKIKRIKERIKKEHEIK